MGQNTHIAANLYAFAESAYGEVVSLEVCFIIESCLFF